jgi:hypothetical protein
MERHRKRSLRCCLPLLALLVACPLAGIAQPWPPDREKHALIISGIGGEEGYQQQFRDWTTRLHKLLIGRLGFAPERVTVLTESPGGDPSLFSGSPQAKSTATEVRRVLSEWQGAVSPRQQIFLFFIGHGTYDGQVGKFNLVGPDLTAAEYAELLARVRAARTTILQLASASGGFLKPLAAPDRIVLTATRSGMEQNAPKFAEYFLKALESSEGDLDKNGRVSVYEAFQFATEGVAGLYRQAGKLATEHALLDDTGDGVGLTGSGETEQKRKPEGESEAKAASVTVADGGLARATYFDSLPQQEAGGDSVLAKWIEERMRLEGAIEQLKSRKPSLAPVEYATQLEKMLTELARLGRTIRQRRQSPSTGTQPSANPGEED